MAGSAWLPGLPKLPLHKRRSEPGECEPQPIVQKRSWFWNDLFVHTVIINICLTLVSFFWSSLVLFCLLVVVHQSQKANWKLARQARARPAQRPLPPAVVLKVLASPARRPEACPL